LFSSCFLVCIGIELGVRALGLGEKGILTCGSRFAFGDIGRPIRNESVDMMVLPPDTDVEIELEVLELGSDKQVGGMEDDERIEECRKKKQIGNDCFEYCDYGRSTRAYSAALKAVDGLLENYQGEEVGDSSNTKNESAPIDATSSSTTLSNKQEKFKVVLKLMVDCGCNIAAAYLRLKEYNKAESSCIAVLQVDANNLKALYRGGIASMHQHKFVEANMAFKMLLEMDPDNKEAQLKFKELQKREKLYKDKEKQIAKKMGANMFGGSNNDDPRVSAEKEKKKEREQEETTKNTVAAAVHNTDIPKDDVMGEGLSLNGAEGDQISSNNDDDDEVNDIEDEAHTESETLTTPKVAMTWQIKVQIATLLALVLAIMFSLFNK
jgi:tetratricopeptide (TPR) repeat protein